MGKFLTFAVVLYGVMALALLYVYFKGWKITTRADLDKPPSRRHDARKPKPDRDANMKGSDTSDPEP